MMQLEIFSKELQSQESALRSFAFKFTRDHEDANDLYQDTILKAIRYFEKFQEGTNFKGWLFTIMRNTFINDYRRAVKRQAVVAQEEELSSAQLLKSSNNNGAEGKFALDDINQALSQIPAAYRYAFIRYFEGYKYHEIAEELQIPIGTVKTRIHITRGLLKKSLKMYAK